MVVQIRGSIVYNYTYLNYGNGNNLCTIIITEQCTGTHLDGGRSEKQRGEEIKGGGGER